MSPSRVTLSCLIVCASIQVVGFISPGMRSLPASVATARLVSQSRQALLQKPLRPLVDKATADADRGGNGGDRDAIGQE